LEKWVTVNPFLTPALMGDPVAAEVRRRRM
jgi:hypothetical protein